ncbi:MAG: hypothetical protein KatS3mg115_1410 [Candidatus Poribacteria bacterium]|nr:MAG: hypothetical protein KatS3mg115_1410 [Candidatus Poribacteria bacterium]
MRCVVFPKNFRELSPPELVRLVSELGFDGVDLIVREGYWLHRGNLEQALPQFVRLLREAGLKAETASTDYLDPNEPGTEEGLALLAEHGVRQYRIRHIPYRGAGTYWEDLGRSRRFLEGLEKLGEKYRLQALVQTHGGTIHPSASATYRLVQGFDPRWVAVHYDPGNLVCQEGLEDWNLGLDVLGDYLALVGVKNAEAFYCPEENRWVFRWTALERGIVPWDRVLRLLDERGYRGLYVFHPFYELELAELIAQTQEDLRYFRRLLGEGA